MKKILEWLKSFNFLRKKQNNVEKTKFKVGDEIIHGNKWLQFHKDINGIGKIIDIDNGKYYVIWEKTPDYVYQHFREDDCFFELAYGYEDFFDKIKDRMK